jgi:hypothetical protein
MCYVAAKIDILQKRLRAVLPWVIKIMLIDRFWRHGGNDYGKNVICTMEKIYIHLLQKKYGVT